MKHWILVLFLLPLYAHAQQLPSIEEKTRSLVKYSGYFNFYYDEPLGKWWLEIDRFGEEFLYTLSLPAGLGSNDIGLDRGLPGESRIVKFVRTGRKILLIQPNYGFRAVTSDAAERRAVEQSFAQSVLWGFTAEASTEGRVLVDATDFFLRDAMQIATRLKKMQQGNYSLDKTRCAPYPERTRSFPRNSDWEAVVTFINNDGSAGGYVQSVAPSAESVTLRIHHSFVALPEPGFRPRRFDPRSSFNKISFYDYSTPVSSPIEQHFAVRHRLEKKDPQARISEPVKPIIYYLDNGTPEPIRSALLEGAAWWNQAFEAAGYKDAFQVKVLPDSADPMDIRYNMINWVHRSTRGWSYGASVVDPRTGEIIKGQVTLGSLRVRQDYMIAQGLLSPFENGLPADDPMLKMSLARLRQLSAHEVGHTLGLMHNYASSTNDRASVMDYPHPLVRLDTKGNISFENAYDNKIGDWDKVAITWGYQDIRNAAQEDKILNSLLTTATQKGLQFISDRDARAPGGLHPYAHLWDNGSDPVKELKLMMGVRSKALENFGAKSIPPGTPMAFLEDVLVPVYLYHRYQAEAVSKLVGGMEYTYALRGDGQQVTAPVSLQKQSEALDILLSCLDPGFLELPERILQLLPPRPAGYDFSRELFKKRTGLAFDALAPAETAADLPLSFLLHTERLSRMAQMEMTGGLGVGEMLKRIIAATWFAPRKKGMQQLIQQQTEQIVLTYLLASSVDESVSYAARGPVLQAISSVKTFAQEKVSIVDPLYAVHLALALERIKSPEKAKATIHLAIPPGAPIGCSEE
jgi:hypothetical protein